MRNDFVGRALDEQLAEIDVGEPMTALGFVHVMRAHEHGDAFGREFVDVLPEVAARLGIHPRSRLVKQQQLRRMQHARGEREPLLPAARQRAGELAAPRGEPEPIERRGDCSATIRDVVHPRNEGKVFLDRQVLVQAEALRHVTDFPLDRRRFAAKIEAKARAVAFVRRQQSAQHADRRRLAAAVRTEKAENRAARHADRHVVDDGAPAIALGEAVNVDGDRRRLRVASTACWCSGRR